MDGRGGQRIVAGVVGVAIGFLQVSARAASPDAPRLGYYVPKDVVYAVVVETTTVTRRIDIDQVKIKPAEVGASVDGGPMGAVIEETRTSREGTVSLKTIADTGLPMAFIDNTAKALSDNTITVELQEGTLLKSVSLASTGRLGDTIVSIAKFAATAVALAAVLAAEKGRTTRVDVLTDCDPHNKPYADQTDGIRLFLARNADACTQFQSMRRISESIQKNTAARIEIEWSIKGATQAELKLLTDKLRGLQEAIDKENKELGALQERFSAASDAFLAPLKIGVTTASRTISRVVELSALLPVATIEAENLVDHTSHSSADAIITSKPDTDKAWKETKALWKMGLIIGVDQPTDATRPDGLPSSDGSDDVAILFRQAVPLRMQVLVSTQPDDKKPEALSLVSDQHEPVIHPNLPIHRVAFKRSMLADRQIGLSFDQKGTPVRLERSGKSSVAALASSIATAATTFRDEYAATLDKVVDIQTSQRAIKLNDLTTRLERAKKDKELLDAKLQLDASTANFESSLKQQQAAQELAQLQAEAALTAAQQTKDQQLDIAKLKVSIDQLKQQIDQLKAQQELDKLQPATSR